MSEINMHLTMNGGEFEATPENTSLFMFAGNLAMYNHVFIVTGETDDQTVSGTYVFSVHSAYEPMRDHMLETGFPQHLNLTQVAKCDLDAYDSMIAQHTSELEGGVPEDWT